MGAAGCIPFSDEYSLIRGIVDLPYDSATLNWIFNFLRRQEVRPIEDLSFTQLKDVASAASDFGFHNLQTSCRLALKCAPCLIPIQKTDFYCSYVRRFRHQCPKEMLQLSVQHGYHALLPTLAATKLIDTPLTSLQHILWDTSIYRAWVSFESYCTSCRLIGCFRASFATSGSLPLNWSRNSIARFIPPWTASHGQRKQRPSTSNWNDQASWILIGSVRSLNLEALFPPAAYLQSNSGKREHWKFRGVYLIFLCNTLLSIFKYDFKPYARLPWCLLIVVFIYLTLHNCISRAQVC